MKSPDELRTQLAARGRGLHRIADESGIPYSWLSKFRCGEISNPTVRSLLRLENYLSKQTCNQAKAA